MLNPAARIVSPTSTFTADQLASTAAQLAATLHAAGLQPGQIVAASLPNSPHTAAAFLAVRLCGAAWFPIHPAWRAPELAAFHARLRFAALLAPQPWPDLCPPICLDPAHFTPVSAPAPNLAHHQPAALFPTSGSTGAPRLVPRSTTNLRAAAQAAAQALEVSPTTRVLSVLPFHHAGAFDNCLLLPLLAGATAVTLPEFNPSTCLHAIAQHQTDLVFLNPFVLASLLDAGATRAHFAPVRAAVSFGAPMPPSLAARALATLGLPIRQLYGSTETGVISVERPNTPQRQGLAGHPLPHHTVSILGPDGELAVSGPGVMQGYLDSPPLQGPYRTGDLAHIDADGALILRGRISSFLNIAGVKVDPTEIQNAILAHPAVADCLVYPLPDPSLGQLAAATIVARPNAHLSRRDVVAHLRLHLAEFKIPRHIEFTTAIPTDLSGKRRAAP